MSARADHFTTAHPPRWWQWLGRELAFTPGRDVATARIVVTVALVTLISLALQVPELAVSAYMVIFVTKENRVLTTLAGTLAILGVTVAIAASLLLYGATFDYPALRIPVVAMMVFAGMYLARVFVVGPLGFAIGFVVALTQSAADGVSTPETLVRALLWLWVALVYPIALTVVVNQILLPAEPWTAFTRALARRLDAASAVLRRADEEGVVGGRRDSVLLELATGGGAPLLKLLHFAEGQDARLKRRHVSLSAAVAADERIISAAAALELGDRQAVSENDRRCARLLATKIGELRATLPSRGPVAVSVAPGSAALPELRELQLAAASLADSLAHEDPAEESPAAEPKEKKSLFVPDAFTNPAHARFALKVSLAAMSCYVLYIGLDWTGIHTAFITCCIIALESNGATRRKGTLRLVGCGVGGLLGFLSIMYLVPRMESVVSLVLLTSAVTALAGWVATGSERIAYGGLQIALAFYLCIFQGFAPGTNFDTIRDRLVGIILGILVSSAVFRFVWPERSGDSLRAILARALHNLAKLALVPTAVMSQDAAVQEAAGLRGEITRDLDAALRLAELTRLENISATTAGRLFADRLTGMVRHAQALLLIGTSLTTRAELDDWDRLEPSARDAEAAARGDAAERLRDIGNWLADGPSRASTGAGVEPTRPLETGGARTDRRGYLVGRFVEQTRLLIAPPHTAGD